MSISSSTADYLITRADAMLADATTKQKVAGLSVAIVCEGKGIYLKGFGLANIAQKRLVTPDTIFRVYSISKTLTAIGLMQLWEQGAFQLDDPVSRYLKAFTLTSPTDHDPPITFRHLLTHTAGLSAPPPSQLNDLLIKEGDRVPSAREYFTEGVTADMPAGMTFSYSNRGFAILGQLIEDISGEPYAQYMQRHVLGPLGMKQSQFALSKQAGSRLAQGYRLKRGRLVPVEYLETTLSASSGLLSSANDMAKYVIALLDGGSHEHGTLLQPETLHLMFQRHFEVDEGPPPAIGLGFRLDPIGSHRIVYHSGGGSGFMSTMLLAPDDRLGMVILSNTNVEMRYQPEYLARTLLDHVWNVSGTAAYLPQVRSRHFWLRVGSCALVGFLMLLIALLWRKLRQ